MVACVVNGDCCAKDINKCSLKLKTNESKRNSECSHLSASKNMRSTPRIHFVEIRPSVDGLLNLEGRLFQVVAGWSFSAMEHPLPLAKYETDCSAFWLYQHRLSKTVPTLKVILLSDTHLMVYGIRVAWKNSSHPTEFGTAKTFPPQRRLEQVVWSHSSVSQLLLFTFNCSVKMKKL
jgi:hypothetical protein